MRAAIAYSSSCKGSGEEGAGKIGMIICEIYGSITGGYFLLNCPVKCALPFFFFLRS